MKLTKLLVLSALWLVGLSAQAADLIKRTAPQTPGSAIIDAEALAAIEKVAVEFEVGKYYVLYNPGAQQYFSQGNNWGTRASVSDLPILVRFTIPEGKTLADNALWLNDYCIYNKAWKNAFFNDADQIYVDRRDQGNYYWQVLDQGNKVYRLQASPLNATLNPTNNPGFVGRDESVEANNSNNEGSRNVNVTNTFPISPFLEEGEGHHIDWVFYSVPAWNVYGDSLDLYNKSEQLKKEIGIAEQGGTDVSAAVAVYNDMNSTIAQMDAAIEGLVEGMKNTYTTGNGEKPGNATFLIVNSTFDTIGDFSGWEGSSFAAGGTTSTNAEWFEKDQNADTYQTLSGLKPGYYIAGVKGFYRAGSTTDSYKHFKAQDNSTRSVQFYVTANGQTYETNVNSNFQGAPTKSTGQDGETSAKDDATGVTYYVPNTMKCAEYYIHQLAMYDNFMLVQVGEDGDLRIGVKKSGEKLGSDWAIFDDFTLNYIGSNPDDYYPGLAYIKLESYPKYEDALATASVLEAYKAALSDNSGRMSLRDQAALDAFIAKVDAAKADLDDNISMWSEWKKLVEEAQHMIIEDIYLEFDEIEPLLDYADVDTYGDNTECVVIEKARNLDNAALKAEMEKLQGMIDDVKNAYKNAIQPNTDVTENFLVNPKFDDKDNGAKYGWTGWGKSTNSAMPKTDGLNTSDKYNMTAEAWNSGNFDLYQEVENAPAGVYEIEVQGFYRYGRGDKAWSYYQEQSEEYVKPGGAPAFVYMNDVATPFKNVYDEESQSQEFYVDCAELDEHGEPKVSETGRYTFKDGLPNVQVIGDENLDVSELKFYPNGMTSAAVAFSAGLYKQTAKSLLAKKGDKLRIGVKGTTTQLGDSWVIFDNFKLTYKGYEVESVKPVLEKAIADAKANLDKGFGTDLRAELIEKLEAAEALLNSEDGKAMFNAAADLVAVDVAASVALFAELSEAITGMQNLAAAQTGITDDATIDAAYALGEEIDGLIEGNNLSDAQAKEYLEKIKEMNAKLKIPAGMADASDANPVPVTTLITNPKYADNKTDGWSGDGASVNYHEAEMFNKTFDYYQDLEGLLPGTYKVTVQGFYRAGGHGPANDYKTLQEDPTANNFASLYAKVGDDIFSTPLKRLCTELVELVAGEDVPGGWSAAKTDTISWQPDTVVQHFIVPNNMEQGEIAFQKTDDAYNYSGNEVVFKVGDDGKARIGIKKDNKLDNDWTLWTNWTLTYYGANSSLEPSLGISTAAGSRVVKTEFFSLSGARLKSARGLVIVKQTMNDGSVRVVKMVK